MDGYGTFGRVLGLLNAEQFQRRFGEWIAAVEEPTQGQVMTLYSAALSAEETLPAPRASLRFVFPQPVATARHTRRQASAHTTLA